MQNLEIKARVSDIEGLLETATRLAGDISEEVIQTDTYFNISPGRLKLREYGETAELIFYERPDTAEPKYSDYFIARIERPDELKEVLGRALGIRTVVRKRRRLLLYGNTRIHIDEVEGLGDFMELEAVMEDGAPRGDDREVVDYLLKEFCVEQKDMVDCSYSDLIESMSGAQE